MIRLSQAQAFEDLAVRSRFYSKVNKQGPILRPELGPCWLWLGRPDPDGYGNFRLGNQTVKPHRLAWAFEHGRYPEPVGLHRCDNPPCVRPSHVMEGTHADNVRDRQAKGRTARGSRIGIAVLDERQVRAMRVLYARGGHTWATIGALFGISASGAGLVLSGKTWR